MKKIVFVSDAFHLHQKGVADALFEMTEGSYSFITTLPLREERKKMGFGNDYPAYVLDASSRNAGVWAKAQQIIDDAETVVLGSAPYELLTNRLAAGKLTFRYSERLWKQYKHYLKTPFYMMDNNKTKGCRLLCASAYAAHDYNMMGAFKDVCYKWGYFTEVSFDPSTGSGQAKLRSQGDSLKVKEDLSTDSSNLSNLRPVRMMWCSRYLDWKHPELPVFLAHRLKDKGYSFHITMYGSGQYYEKAVELVRKLNLNDVITFTGNVPNEIVHQTMRESDIFLFTSDRGEGWGAVANEAMSEGCVLVAGNEIGSVPYLVKDKENGCTFKSSSRCKGFGRFGVSVDQKSLDSLVEKVEWLINNPSERKRLSENAIKTMQETWNPRVAAENLLTLIEDIKQGRDTSIKHGPCSKA